MKRDLAASTPLQVIEPAERESVIAALRRMWVYRELVWLLAWKDYKVRYRQTAIGIAWAVLQPLLTSIAFVFIFGRFHELTDTGVPYPLFVFSGLVAWQFFSGAVSDAGVSLVQNRTMVTKVSFPRLVIPMSKVVVQFVDLCWSGLFLLVFMLFFRHLPPVPGILLLIPVLLLLFAASASIGVIFSAIDVKFRDVQYVLPYFIQLGLFISPVIYQTASLGSYGWFLYLNPMTGVIEAFRAALFSLPFPVVSFSVSILVTCALSLVGLRYFIRKEGDFSDII